MTNSCALVNHNATVLFEEPDQLPRVISRRLENLDTLFDGRPGITFIVWWIDRRQKGNIDTERFGCEFASFTDRVLQRFGVGLGECSEDSQTAAVGNSSN